MSRTYRIRHLRKFGVNHYTDGKAGWNHKRRYDYYEDLLQEHFADLQVHFYWKWELMKQLEYQYPVPAAWFLNHPWVGWTRVCGIKKWYRTNGNRWSRRRSRSLIKKMPHDDEYDNRHKFPDRRQEMWDIWSIC